MSTNTLHEYRTGWKRALIQTKISLTSPGDLLGFLMPTAIAVVVLLFMQKADFEGAPVSLGSMNMPSLIGMNVVFGGIMGMVGSLAMDRTNGTLLRAKSMPGGMTGYLVGHLASTAIFTTIMALVLLLVGLPLFDGLEFDSPDRWLIFISVLLMGIVATLPIGAVLGALLDNPRNMGLVMFPIMGMVAISGIFYPITALPTWLQGIGQAFPMYWMGLGMRHALLPDSMAAVEIGGEWRTVTMFAVLAVWAVVSMALAPRLLRRMSRRESGSAVAARRADMQRDW
ncbi:MULTISPECIES: ABC transporter permease [Glycomyces]|jgi:ABC-2 type transport system permease protein|uniref:ABC transporter permease n=2 Tax=Glycomyces TaxID=58113 RepID=A0A9X3PHC7_9ACTN|nr:ABC transporter permease [Glycomyces lechevalierae]MDA1385494.1 ABC transporter permease [Glycomyces lechevalierae]MDR7339669.1 ABC-2 type transport system permease protein [Glycomyces lechevalierae]